MTRRVVAVSPDTSILAAARLMLEHHISGLPVVDASGHVVAIVSESDLLRDDGKGWPARLGCSSWSDRTLGPASRRSLASVKSPRS
ncbi:MAG: CBS domain-containing protein [Xanthobacteraceae bacterium]